jgi:hypothetical protein
MSYRPYVWRKNNPEKRQEQARREKVRTSLRKKGILPPVGEVMNDEQLLINEQIGNNDFTYWNSIKLTKGNTKPQSRTNIKSPEYLIWYRAKQSAKEYKKDFDLSVEDIIIPTHCPYLGVELLTNKEECYSPNYYSIDRIDSTKGYVKGNIQIISRFSNTIKNNATIDQLVTFSQNVLKMYEAQIS